jgi:hypothetical protein
MRQARQMAQTSGSDNDDLAARESGDDGVNALSRGVHFFSVSHHHSVLR